MCISMQEKIILIIGKNTQLLVFYLEMGKLALSWLTGVNILLQKAIAIKSDALVHHLLGRW